MENQNLNSALLEIRLVDRELTNIEVSENLVFHWLSIGLIEFRVKLSSDSDSPWSITCSPSVVGAKICFLVSIKK